MEEGATMLRFRQGGWRGRRSTTLGDDGRRSLLRGEDCYVSPDGAEIRTRPGWICVADPTTTATDGYQRRMIDGYRPVAQAGGTSYRERVAHTEALLAWSEPVHFHGFEQVRGKVVVICEWNHRREPLIDSLGNEAFVTRWIRDTGNRAKITLDRSVTTGGTGLNRVRRGQWVWIGNLVDANVADAARLNNRFHIVFDLVGGTQIVLSTTVSADSVSIALTGLIGRTAGNRSGTGNSADTDGRGYYGEQDIHAIDDPEALGVLWIEDPLSVNTVTSAGFPSWVANRIRDFSDTAGTDMVEGHRTPSTLQYGLSRRRQRSLPFRAMTHADADRILIAVPGYGCCFQVPALMPVTASADISRGLVYRYNDLYDRPRCTGLPKAIMLVPEAVNGNPLATVHVGAGGFPGGAYKIACAYRDGATGEIGQLSEPWVFTNTPGGPDTLDISIMVQHPGYVMPESCPNEILVFLENSAVPNMRHVLTITLGENYTAGAGVSQSALHGLRLTAATGAAPPLTLGIPAALGGVDFFDLYALPAALIGGTTFDGIALPLNNVQPRGAKCIRTIRGVTVMVGAAGTVGARREMIRGEMVLSFDATLANGDDQPDVMTIRRCDLSQNPFDVWPLIGNGLIPAAYGGLKVFTRGLPYPREFITLDRVYNSRTGNPTFGVYQERRNAQRWHLVDDPHQVRQARTKPTGSAPGTGVVAGLEAFLKLERGQAQLSELDNPGVTDLRGVQILDPRQDDDLEAIGEYRGIGVACSSKETKILEWSRGPAAAAPFDVSGEFGCIAPRGMVEWDQGCAFISARGPCTLTPFKTVEWIGRDLEPDFHGATARYKRDSTGMMHHAFGVHDEKRGCILWGLFADSTQQVTVTWKGFAYPWGAIVPQLVPTEYERDQIRSRFPADEILVWNYRTNAFTWWFMPPGFEAVSMRMIRFADGQDRLCWLARDGRIYAFDDTYCEGNKAPVIRTLNNAGGTGTVLTLSVPVGQSITDRQNGNFVFVGQHVVLVDNLGRFKARRKLAAFGANGLTVTLDSSITWTSGDLLYIGQRTMTVQPSWINLKGADNANLSGIGVRYSIKGQEAQRCWGQSRGRVNKRLDAPETSKDVIMSAATGYDEMGAKEADEVNRVFRAARGRPDGEEVRLTLEFIGGGQVCLQDLIPEIG